MSAKLELSPATRAATASAVDDIAAVLAHPPPPDDGDELLALSVFGYDAGYALFYAYLDRLQPRAQWKRLGNRHPARAIARGPDASDRPFFAYGFSGTGWAVQHLAGWFVNVDDDTLSDVDDVLTMLVEQAPTVSLDLQHGLVGFGLYALERLPTASARRLLEAVIDRLGAAAE